MCVFVCVCMCNILNTFRLQDLQPSYKLSYYFFIPLTCLLMCYEYSPIFDNLCSFPKNSLLTFEIISFYTNISYPHNLVIQGS